MADSVEVQDARTPGFFWVDNRVLDEFGEELGVYGIAVYCVLARHASRDGRSCFPSLSTIAGLSKTSVPTVIKALKTLKALGLISSQERKAANGATTSNLYTILQPPSKADLQAPYQRGLQASKAGLQGGSNTVKRGSKPGLQAPINDVKSNKTESEQDSVNKDSPVRDADGGRGARGRGRKLPDALLPEFHRLRDLWVLDLGYDDAETSLIPWAMETRAMTDLLLAGAGVEDLLAFYAEKRAEEWRGPGHLTWNAIKKDFPGWRTARSRGGTTDNRTTTQETRRGKRNDDETEGGGISPITGRRVGPKQLANDEALWEALGRPAILGTAGSDPGTRPGGDAGGPGL